MDRDVDLVRVTLRNPEARNAQTPATWRRLARIPDVLTPEVRAVVLCGEGPSFSAGLDRRMLTPEGVPGEESLAEAWRPSTMRRDGRVHPAAQAAFTWWA